MEYISPTPWIDSIVFGLVLAVFTLVVFRFWIPPRVHVFLRQCCQRFITLFTGWTNIPYWSTEKDVRAPVVILYIELPNALIVVSYLFCCIMAIILL
jgi:hypothetical protein